MNPTDNNIIYFPSDIKLDLNRSFSKYIFEDLKKHGTKIAQIDSTTNKKETFSEMLQRSTSLAQALKAFGITSNDIISICCYNNMDYVIVIIASIFIGARFNTIDITASKFDINQCLNLVKPRILFCENEVENVLKSELKSLKINCTIVSFDKSPEFLTIDNFIKKYKSNEEFQIDTSRKLKDTGAILLTSGTSGVCKGAQLSNFGLYNGGLVFSKFGQRSQNFMFCTLPYWISNIVVVFTIIAGGGTRVNFKTYNKDLFFKVVQDCQVTSILLTQFMINEFIQNPKCCQYNTSNLKYIYFGGSQVCLSQITELKKLLPHSNIINIYGMTEVAGMVAGPNMDKIVSDENGFISVGKPNKGIFYKIVDIETEKSLGPKVQGEFRIKYQGIMNGYFNEPEKTKEVFDENGFFKTGDLAYYDEKLNFFIVDRIKEIFKYKGLHVSPSLIEDVLLLNPGVKEAAIISLPDEQDGEHAMAVVVLHKNVNLSEGDIIQLVKEKLPNQYHLRKGVKFIDCLPRTNTGKIRRKHLKDLILKQI